MVVDGAIEFGVNGSLVVLVGGVGGTSFSSGGHVASGWLSFVSRGAAIDVLGAVLTSTEGCVSTSFSRATTAAVIVVVVVW